MPEGGVPIPNAGMRLRVAIFLLATAMTIACEPSQQRRSSGAETLVDETVVDEPQGGGPVVGGPCTYEPFEFRAAVDSALSDGTLLVSALDAVTTDGRCHLLQDAGEGHWRVLTRGGNASPTRGDTVDVSGEVITTGTCTPCALGYSLASGRDR